MSNIYVCCAVDEGEPAVPSLKMPCEGCQKMVWVDGPAYEGVKAMDPTVVRLCTQCAVAKMEQMNQAAADISKGRFP